MEALYQTVWAQVFAMEWHHRRTVMRQDLAAATDASEHEAGCAAAMAVARWDDAEMRDAIVAKNAQS